VAQKADMVRTLAKINVKHIEKAFGVPSDRVAVLYDGVNLSRFQGLSFSGNKVKRRIVTAGRLIPSKGTEDTLKVFERILKQWPDASLVVLGDGPELERLQRLAESLDIKHAVTFKGHVRHEVVFEEMSQAEVFLFMSKKSSERLPNVVKEAMGCRCLCITTETPGIEELLVNGQHGYVVAQGDIETVSRLIEQAFTDNSTTQAMTEAAYRHLERNFDLIHIMTQYHERWKNLVTQKQAKKTNERFNSQNAKRSGS
jgi:glycosyltransferase involved in cell wall biosynthesis